MSKLFKKLESLVERGNDAEIKIASQLVKHDTDISEMSAIALGGLCGVSNASIVRFAQSLGYKGYSVFKLDYMAAQKHRVSHSRYSEIDSNDSLQMVIKKSSYLMVDNLEQAYSLLKPELIEEASTLLFNAERVIIVSLGSSTMVASLIAQKLMQVNKAVLFQFDSHFQSNCVAQMSSKDVVFALSGSGDAAEIVNKIKKAKQRGGKIVSISRRGQSKVNALSDIALPFTYREDHLDMMGSAVQISQLAIFDIIFYQLLSLMSVTGDDTDELRRRLIAETSML